MTAKAPLAARCGRCSRRVLEVRADHHLGVLIGAPRLDPVGLTRDQVVACVLIGIRVWQIQERSGRASTSLRTRYWPTRPVDGHTAPEHTCTRTWDAPALDLAPDEVVYPDQPPF